MMRNIRWGFLILSILTFLCVGIYYADSVDSDFYAESGIIDLSDTNLEQEGQVVLNGEWEFYYGAFLRGEKLTSKIPDYIKVPGIWTRDARRERYPARGIATFRLILQNIPEGKFFAFEKSSIRNASRMYVNDELVMEDGRVSETSSESVAGNMPKLVFVELPEGRAEIIFHVSNHEYIHGGIARPLLFGYQEIIQNQHEKHVLFESAMILISSLVGLLYLILFLSSRYYRKAEPAVLSFSLSTLFFGLMGSMYGERILGIVFPSLTLDGIFRIGHGLAACTAIWMISVISHLYRDFLSKRQKNRLIGIFSLMFVFILFFPLHIYMYSIYFYMYFVTGVFLLLSIRILWWILHKENIKEGLTEHILYAIAIFSAFIFWLDEMLYSFGIIYTMNLSYLSMALYSISMAALLLYRYSLQYRRSAELSNELVVTLAALTESTSKMEQKEMSFLHAQIKPHFLFNTLNVISSQILEDPDKAHELVSALGEFLHAKFSFENNQYRILIEEELSLVRSYLEIEKSRFEERLEVIWDMEENIYFHLPPFTVQPLVENAVKHGLMEMVEGGKVKISVKRSDRGYQIRVTDDGVGMPEQKIRSILEGDTMARGVGLQNVHKRLHYFYKTGLQIDSELDEGTSVYFEIPWSEVNVN